ncbi:MAG TPA: ParB/RepB/Spo0J family partition protein [Gemmatimonadaceae bacterium]|jgi:ParB family chromosome partitioning protein|nr:ParB/RepB/Spo0J family partition protein [Gemmatimonadaceae bacterium]
MADKPRRLGRGLEALIGATPTSSAAVGPATIGPESPLRTLSISRIRPNPFQPRREFHEADLAQLEASLRETGLLQPITVRAVDDHYELVAGERRLRAATRLGWTEIPAIVKDFDDRALLTLALVENLQRADLNPIEEAEGYARLIAEFALTQQDVANVVGKDRSTVANSLRLLNLPASVRRMLQDGHLTVGHARALLALPNERMMVDVARETVAKSLSVRDVERIVKQRTTPARQPNAASPEKPSPARAAEVRRLTDRLRRRLQTDVTLEISEKDRGELRIAFYSADDLNRLIELITGHNEDL